IRRTVNVSLRADGRLSGGTRRLYRPSVELVALTPIGAIARLAPDTGAPVTSVTRPRMTADAGVGRTWRTVWMASEQVAASWSAWFRWSASSRSERNEGSDRAAGPPWAHPAVPGSVSAASNIKRA